MDISAGLLRWFGVFTGTSWREQNSKFAAVFVLLSNGIPSIFHYSSLTCVYLI